MYITKSELISKNACNDGLERFIKQTNNSNDPIKITSLIGGHNTDEDLLWLASRVVSTEMLNQFTIKCSKAIISDIKVKELVEPIVSAISLIELWIQNPTNINKVNANVATDKIKEISNEVAYNLDPDDVYSILYTMQNLMFSISSESKFTNYNGAISVVRCARAIKISDKKINQCFIEMFVLK